MIELLQQSAPFSTTKCINESRNAADANAFQGDEHVSAVQVRSLNKLSKYLK